MKRYKIIFSILSVLIVFSIFIANTIRPLANPIVETVQFSTFIPAENISTADINASTKQILAISGVKQLSVAANNSISVCYNSNAVTEQALNVALQNILSTKVSSSNATKLASKCPIQKEWLNNYRECFNFLQPVFQLFNA
jgi:hypothetical protein